MYLEVAVRRNNEAQQTQAILPTVGLITPVRAIDPVDAYRYRRT